LTSDVLDPEREREEREPEPEQPETVPEDEPGSRRQSRTRFPKNPISPRRTPPARESRRRSVDPCRRALADRAPIETSLTTLVCSRNRAFGTDTHRALDLKPPIPGSRLQRVGSNPNQLQRRDRLGGLIPEYARAA
jgi:hypothetical protein